MLRKTNIVMNETKLCEISQSCYHHKEAAIEMVEVHYKNL